MANGGATCLYKEARLNIEPAYPGSTVSITLPASTTSTFGFSTAAKRTVITEQYQDQDDEAFAKRHLASDGSMFFRQHNEYPRSFLWRMLDNRKTLEIQATDLDQDVKHRFEANLTVLLHFSTPIRPFGIAFGEPDDRDALTVFAITTANELYTITLHRDFFTKLTASEVPVEDWCKRCTPNLVQLRVPYRLVAVSASELLISLDDGGILHLTKQNRDDAAWKEDLYKQGNWSFRGLLPWKGQHTVRFNNADLDSSAAAALAISPDRQHIFAVSLNHQIRAWNVNTGKPGVQRDLLGEPDLSHEKVVPHFIGPSQSTLLAVLDIAGTVDGSLYHVVTYSPKQHQFKFWGIRDPDNNELGMSDIHSEVAFVPPVDEMMRTTVWNLEEFFINPGPKGLKGLELWIRARSGPSSKVYSLKFDLTEDSGRLAHAWKHNWICVDSGPLTVDGLRLNPANPSEQDPDAVETGLSGSTEQWIEFLFHPGRFTVATLETALTLFRRGLKSTRSSNSSRKGSLKDRISETVAAFTAQVQDNIIDYDEYEEAVSARWQTFYGLVKDLHKRRGDSLSLVFDSRLEMPWLVLADCLSAIRKCSPPEVIALNATIITSPDRLTEPLLREIPNSDARHIARLLNAAASFRRNLPISFNSKLQWHVNNELQQSQSLSVPDRMEQLEVKLDLSRQVSDDDLNLLVEELGMSTKDLPNEMFFEAIRALDQEEQGRTSQKKQIARFGLDALARVSQETLEISYNVLLDLLVLILFMHFEEELSDDFEASEIFIEICNQLKNYAVLRWLASTTWSHSTSTGPSSEELMKALDEKYKNKGILPITQTVLEGIFGHRCFDTPLPSRLKSNRLTYWSRVWLNEVFGEQTFDGATEMVMGILLSQKEYALALEFSRFLQETNWSVYLKGRMHLALGELDLASICFQKAAYTLGVGMFSIDDADTINFIPPDQRNYFSDGLSNYYHHILGLFEKAKAYSFTADFARLGLRSLVGEKEDHLKSDLLSRLFSASIQTSRFDDAYSAMTRQKDENLKHSALQTLVTTMIQQSQTKALLKYPFVGLINDVDAVLSSHCHKTLNLSSGPPYHQILYAFRIGRNDFRGAASILYERLQRLKTTSAKVHDPADESLTQCYLMIINTLSSVSEEEAYILAEQRLDDIPPPQWNIGKARKLLKRQIVTLDTLRKEYQAELDRVATIESGQYPFVEPAEEMDIL